VAEKSHRNSGFARNAAAARAIGAPRADGVDLIRAGLPWARGAGRSYFPRPVPPKGHEPAVPRRILPARQSAGPVSFGYSRTCFTSRTSRETNPAGPYAVTITHSTISYRSPELHWRAAGRSNLTHLNRPAPWKQLQAFLRRSNAAFTKAPNGWDPVPPDVFFMKPVAGGGEKYPDDPDTSTSARRAVRLDWHTVFSRSTPGPRLALLLQPIPPRLDHCDARSSSAAIEAENLGRQRTYVDVRTASMPCWRSMP